MAQTGYLEGRSYEGNREGGSGIVRGQSPGKDKGRGGGGWGGRGQRGGGGGGGRVGLGVFGEESVEKRVEGICGG